MLRAARNRLTATAAMVAGTVLLAACAGNGEGLDSNGQPLTPGAGGNGPLMADFDSIQAQIFTPICTVCHAGAGAPQGLRLDAADSFNLLVNVPSSEVPDLVRVLPGDPDNSYLIQKLEGHAAVGARMPLGGPYLSGDTIAVIRLWITDGASRSSAAESPAWLQLVAAPAAGEVLIEPPPQIMLGFDHVVTRFEAASVRIERRATDDMGAPMEIVTARAAVPAANPRALLLWPLHSLSAGHYRVLVRSAQGDTLLTRFEVEAVP